jgi:hypothetical protein
MRARKAKWHRAGVRRDALHGAHSGFSRFGHATECAWGTVGWVRGLIGFGMIWIPALSFLTTSPWQLEGVRVAISRRSRAAERPTAGPFKKKNLPKLHFFLAFAEKYTIRQLKNFSPAAGGERG